MSPPATDTAGWRASTIAAATSGGTATWATRALMATVRSTRRKSPRVRSIPTIVIAKKLRAGIPAATTQATVTADQRGRGVMGRRAMRVVALAGGASEPELLHPEAQGAGAKAEPLRRLAPPLHGPPALLEHAEDVGALGVLEGVRPRPGCRAGPRRARQPE